MARDTLSSSISSLVGKSFKVHTDIKNLYVQSYEITDFVYRTKMFELTYSIAILCKNQYFASFVEYIIWIKCYTG